MFSTYIRVHAIVWVVLLAFPSCQRDQETRSNLKQVAATRSNGCGPRALATLFELMGISTEESELAVLAGMDERGFTSMYGLVQAVKAKGLEAIGYQLSIEELNSVPFPVIAHVKGNHFVVVSAYNPPNVTVIDNRHKSDIITSDFAQMWSGSVLVVQR